jgi:hypothetical protein
MSEKHRRPGRLDAIRARGIGYGTGSPSARLRRWNGVMLMNSSAGEQLVNRQFLVE